MSESPKTHRHSPPRNRFYTPTYSQYPSYRDHLEDEFDFRCGYCLMRKIWGDALGFEIDHFFPKEDYPHLTTDYDNLVYSCAPCNRFKDALLLPLKPLQDSYSDHIAFDEDLTAVGLTNQGKEVIRILKLNDKERRPFRLRIARIWKKLRHDNPELLLGFPTIEQMPDLTRKRPYDEATEKCYFKLHEKNQLPKVFISQPVR